MTAILVFQNNETAAMLVSQPIFWELNSFLIQTLSFLPINLHRCWPREWKHSITHCAKETDTNFGFFRTESFWNCMFVSVRYNLRAIPLNIHTPPPPFTKDFEIFLTLRKMLFLPRNPQKIRRMSLKAAFIMYATRGGGQRTFFSVAHYFISPPRSIQIFIIPPSN